jgi:hypothetical protein
MLASVSDHGGEHQWPSRPSGTQLFGKIGGCTAAIVSSTRTTWQL